MFGWKMNRCGSVVSFIPPLITIAGLRRHVEQKDLSSSEDQSDSSTSPPKNLSLQFPSAQPLSLPSAFYYHLSPILSTPSLPAPFLPHNPHTLTDVSPTMAAASSAVFSLAAGATSRRHNGGLSPANVSFQGLRPLANKATRAAAASTSAAPRRSGAIRAELFAPVVISLSTGLSLFLGRFVFFNFQRENVAKQGLPEQNGKTHFEAGDVRAQEYVSLLKSNDPVGFNIVDVLAWGSIGHIVAYYILATTSNGYDPKFFG